MLKQHLPGMLLFSIKSEPAIIEAAVLFWQQSHRLLLPQ